MAAIYGADIFCDDCAEDIKERITRDLWFDRPESECPDGADCLAFADLGELKDYLEGMDERTYDSGDYPKHCPDDAESDCPEHCGSGPDCLNYGELSDGTKFGYCFGNSLTSDGEDYVKEAVCDGIEDGVAREVWAVEYSYLDFDTCAECGDHSDCLFCDLCSDCYEKEENGN